ncbi:hypothetical protein [Palaeococcus ferrophilus]|uniref:hypothetical protein n=1 Tax=Palaeococcus ferrophilus TaxID=83868 RepID=UPI00064ED4A5|nr:hypothetical protein [Palaeococcus ferrophilus]
MRSGVFFVLGLTYLLLALTGKLILPELLGPLNLPALAYALMFMMVVYVGYSMELSDKRRTYLYLIAGLTVVGIAAGPIGALVGIAIVLGGELSPMLDERARGNLYVLGILAMVVLPLTAAYRGVIPIIRPETRYSELKDLYQASAAIAALLVAYRPSLPIFLLGEGMALTSTFRTNVLLVFLAYLLRGGKRELKRALYIGTPLVLLGFLARFYVTKSVYPVWHLDFIRSILYRAGFSYRVYERLFSLGFPFGGHALILNPTGRELVASLFGRSANYTYTLFGQPAYDLGLLGLFEGLFLGIALRDADRSPTLGALAVAFLIVALETGIDPLNFGVLMGAAYFGVRRYGNGAEG